jgi:hypothetical protein
MRPPTLVPGLGEAALHTVVTTNQDIVATQHRSSDLGAALTGLVVGTTVLFAIVFAIVKMTNASYAGHESPAPAAQTSDAH